MMTNSGNRRAPELGGGSDDCAGLNRWPRGVVMAGILVALLGAAWAPASSEPAARVVTVDPYRHVDWTTVGHRKGNLHTHTTQSDGQLPVADAIDAYHQLGYEVLAITDHNRSTWPWTKFERDPAGLGMLAIAGNELSRHHHANSLFSTFTTPSTDLGDSIQGVAEKGGLVLLCHPAMHWPREHPGSTASVSVRLGTGLETLTQGDLTVEAWFRTTDPGRHVLLGNYSGSYQGTLNLELHTDNRVRLYCQPRTGPTVDLNVSATPFDIDTRDGEWHHLAAARNQGWWQLFLDGQRVGQTADTTASHPRSRVRPAVSDRQFPLSPETLALAEGVSFPVGEAPGNQVEFGVLSDLHYGFFPRALTFLEAFMADAGARPTDFIIQLGDFCKPRDGKPARDLWNTFAGPRYHVLGNHDMDGGATAEQTVGFMDMPARFYTFDIGRLRGIVLDGNEPGGSAGGYRRYIGAEQRAWLARQLAETDRPVILFVHQPPDQPASTIGLENGPEIMEIIQQAQQNRPGTVIALFSGHLHNDYALTYQGIPYIQINSASYLWYDPVRMVEYAEPIWGRVTVDFDAGELRVKGRETSWAKTTPWDHGATDGAFDLNGAVYYLGRDTRTGETQLKGALGPVRFWTTGLSESDIAALARGARPDDLAVPRHHLLAEYRMETSDGRPLAAAAQFEGQLDDTAGHPQGPFHATASGADSLAIIQHVPTPPQTSVYPPLALGFIEITGVPESAVQYYRDIFVQHPVLFGMEVLNGTRPLREYPLDRELWDALLGELMPGRPVWGIATDDMHSTVHLGRDWAVFLTQTLDEAAVRHSLEQGAYYFSTTRVRPAGEPAPAPPRIERIHHDPGAAQITIVATDQGQPLPESACAWISHGAVVHTGWTLDYRANDLLPAEARYARAEITGPGGTTYTNPFGFSSRP